MNANVATTQEQSARLLRCGVSADTADMCWHGAIVSRGGSLTSMPEPSEEWDLWATPYGCMPDELQAAKLMEDYTEIVPAWSLSALLSNVLPKHLDDFPFTQWIEPFSGGEICEIEDDDEHVLSGDVKLSYEENAWIVDYDWDGFTGVLPNSDNPIEACVRAIELLYANGYKLNGIEEGGENV